MSAAAKPRTVRGWAVLFANGQLLADNDGEGDHPDEYRCLIVPDVRCEHADAIKDGQANCEKCGAFRYRGSVGWLGWRKPAILRAGRAKR